jgi:hypothetical protein
MTDFPLCSLIINKMTMRPSLQLYYKGVDISGPKSAVYFDMNLFYSTLHKTTLISLFNNSLNYLLTSRCRALLEKLTGLQLVKKFPAFHGTRRFITALTSVRHMSLSWASPIQSTYTHPTSWRSILILSTHLHLFIQKNKQGNYMISNCRPVLNAVCFLLGNSTAYEFSMPTLRNAVCSILIDGWV